jgi:hypothetical protein
LPKHRVVRVARFRTIYKRESCTRHACRYRKDA